MTAEEAGSAMAAAGVKNAVFVQCCNSCQEEIDWVDKLARDNTFIKGIVGGVDLTSKNLRSELESRSKLLVGVRHILDVEDPDWLLREDVHAGLAELERQGLAFDLLVRPPILKHVPTLAKKFPNLRMVIDHISKPYISHGLEAGLAGWKEDMTAAASHHNVHCKISGLVTEVDPDHYAKQWTVQTFQPYVRHVLEVFGPDRCMFGSDWPVCKLTGAQYKDVLDLFSNLVGHLNKEEIHKIAYTTAINFYKLKNID